MLTGQETQKIKEIIENILQKMLIEDFVVEINSSADEKENLSIANVNINLKEPQVLIGLGGQTLLDLQRILRVVATKSLKKNLSLRVDINNYKEKKIDYLKTLAQESADEVLLTQRKKILPPMPAYQRRIVHMELAGRKDVATESQGAGENRSIVISPVLPATFVNDKL